MQDVKTRAMQAAIEIYGAIPAADELAQPKFLKHKKSHKKPVYGVGINDADYLTSITVRIGKTQHAIWCCPAYKVWTGMLMRAYYKKYKEIQPTYADVRVCSEWHNFSNFREWFSRQDWQGKHIDKDILFPGCKIYSPDTCIFVSRKVNNFFTDRGALRGKWPIGVSWDSGKGKFVSNVSVNGKLKHLGQFSDPDSAHAAWLKAKYELAIKIAAEQTDKRLADAILNHPIFDEIASGAT